MNRKTLVFLGSCLVFAIGVVVTLYATTYRIVHKRGDFLREYKNFAAVESSEMDIEFNSWYIAGATGDQIYLGNVTAPFSLLVTNSTFTDSQRVNIRIKGIGNPTISASATVKIDPPNFYLVDGIRAVLYKGKIGEWEAERFYDDKTVSFTGLQPISKTSFAFRASVDPTGENILGKAQVTTSIKYNQDLLQKQVDGVFCTDGMLQYNTLLNRLIYTYFYRNEYIVYDTNLNLDYRGHTIDTFSRAQIKIGHISSSNRNKLMDRSLVNLRTCTSGNYLFVKSNILSKNDVKERLAYESIIDVYDVRSGTYAFSFTLPNYGDARVRDFFVVDAKTLIALYDHFMVRYDLQQRYFQ